MNFLVSLLQPIATSTQDFHEQPSSSNYQVLRKLEELQKIADEIYALVASSPENTASSSPDPTTSTYDKNILQQLEDIKKIAKKISTSRD